jgi:hypothetical protein
LQAILDRLNPAGGKVEPRPDPAKKAAAKKKRAAAQE